MADAELLFRLSAKETAAAYHALSNTKIKGRSDSRIHKRIFTAIKAECMQVTDEFNGNFVGGNLILDQDAFDYLCDIVAAVIEETGYPGQFAEGYVDLDEQLQTIRKIQNDAVKAAKAEKEVKAETK
jgi:hypothetical protein